MTGQVDHLSPDACLGQFLDAVGVLSIKSVLSIQIAA